MASKKASPLLSHCELICYAIRGIDAEINAWEQKIRSSGITDEGKIKNILSEVAADALNKRNFMTNLYLIETGTQYR